MPCILPNIAKERKNTMIKFNPTEDIDVSFNNYVSIRQRVHTTHLEGGIPDYAFASDYTLRQKIKAMPGIYPFFKALTGTYVPRQKQMINMQGLRVGADQYSDIYNMTVECAEMLGIGIPTVYIMPEISSLNAYTIATDDESPIIVLHSSIVERLTRDELRTVIGHECGHIHNNHGIYSIAVQVILEQSLSIPIVAQILSLMTMPLKYMFMAWQRAAEVTCDRAGIICANNPMDILKADVKFMYGAMLGSESANIDAALKQYDVLRKTPVKFLELDLTHPVTVRRMYADLEFHNSELLYKWRPEWRKPDMHLIDKQELDLRCEKYVSVLKSEVAKR